MANRLMLGIMVDQENDKSRREALRACFTLVEKSIPSAGARVNITIDGLIPRAEVGLVATLKRIGWMK